ncbi:polysaccharide pyruvyl transferase family protein [Sunxiuqinia elliptica]|uniref:Polysaccharide pyruvyl transferase WcaK-like protein n=1 Tax=Sunxiuqinia elliptica TaxID=655355 RepID=A0A4R6H5E7_9BACT|nr:polysaccharide pyruvyl transferase family protein [Sunxiuqinia elliptica]TDO02676.1 polysaccharide pyruvyl transferase WcaK-like protein [Sunxiuqinia elliptica]TDO58586.1 polysaccharide pyruvyl transferase WcaK-like protein [Sunxiuqinia elliptica]
MKILSYVNNYHKQRLKIYIKSYLNRKENGSRNISYLDLGILNPAIGTSNLGDSIIFESVYRELRDLFDEDLFTSFPTQIHTSYDAKYLMSQKDLLFVAGTNLLASNLEERMQWKLTPSHRRFLSNKVVLVGCGWWQYQENPNNYTSKLYERILNHNLIHSARDSYTVKKLNSIGIENVLNTTCPTLWNINPEFCSTISRIRKRNVITTLTFYNKNKSDDLEMLTMLSNHYETVLLWVQGYEDIVYLNELNQNIRNIDIIPPTLEALDAALSKGDCDYIGTRLHAGIRAIQNGIRSLILAVDNRALEIGKDVNLNVIERADVSEVKSFINGEYETAIVLPEENIRAFKASLKNYRSNSISK